MNPFTEFIKSELTELETRDVDTLYTCILENVEEMLRRRCSEVEKDQIEDAILTELNGVAE